LLGRPARFAGDLMLAAQTRTFGLVYEDSPSRIGLRDAEALERSLRRAGVELLDSVGFAGSAGTAAAAGSAEARRVVSRLRQAGVTSVLYVGDGLFPVFMTQEATRQGYGPEWVLLGAGAGSSGGGGDGGLTGADATFAGRTYDQTQWAHAFGLSFAGARMAQGQGEAWRVHAWHTGQPPPARRPTRRYSTFQAAHPRAARSAASASIRWRSYRWRQQPPWTSTTTGCGPGPSGSESSATWLRWPP